MTGLHVVGCPDCRTALDEGGVGCGRHAGDVLDVAALRARAQAAGRVIDAKLWCGLHRVYECDCGGMTDYGRGFRAGIEAAAKRVEVMGRPLFQGNWRRYVVNEIRALAPAKEGSDGEG